MNPEEATTVAAIAACVAAIIALAAALIAIWQARYTTRVQALLQCDSMWTSDTMYEIRRRAAQSLVMGQTSGEIDRVLDFFETIAGIFVKRRGVFRWSVIPDEWARHTFYWSAACYWCKSRGYIETVQQRQTEKLAWENLCQLMPRWIAEEGGPPSAQDVSDFMDDERSG